MDKILHSDIIQEGDPFFEAIEGAKQLLTAIRALKDEGEVRIKATIINLKSSKPNTPEGQHDIANESANIDKMSKAMSGLNTAAADVNKQYIILTTSSKKYGDQVAKLTKAEREALNVASQKATEETEAILNISRALVGQTELEKKVYKTKSALSAQRISEIKAEVLAGQKAAEAKRRDNERMLASAIRVRDEIRKADNKAMLAGAKKVMGEYQSDKSAEAKAVESLARQRQRASEAALKQEVREKELRAAMNMQAKSIEDLQKQTNALIAARKKVDITTKEGRREYDQLTAAIRRNNDELKKHDARIGNHQRSVGNYVMAIRNAWLGYMAAMAGTVMAVKRYINMNAELDDAMASVRRTTGMTQKEVYGLNETLRSFNTRTSQKSLLDLAHVAGKLGIAKNDIAGFVKAADMIGVALGKDIGNNEEAINQLGRIVQIFKLNIGSTMEEALLKVGSAIKDLGNASVAEETNILDFTKRLGGLAPAAGVSVDKIMGLAATYDILGQTMEVSSTATSQIWIGMAQKTEEFARIAGMTVKDFSALMKKDFNEAFIAFVTGLQKGKGGIEELASYFDGLGLDGRRIIGVMTVLSDKIGVYRDQMRIAKQSLDAGTTAAEQFAIQNQTLAASIEKLNKAWRNFLANSGSINAFRKAVDGLAFSFRKMSADFSDDELEKLTVRLEQIKGRVSVSLFNLFTGKPIVQSSVTKDDEKLIEQIEARIEEIKKEREHANKVNETIKERIRLERELIAELRVRFGLKSTDEERIFMSTQEAFFPQQAIRKKGIMEQPDLVPKESEYEQLNFEKEQTEAARKKAIDDEKKRQEAYYQFLLKLGLLTADRIVEHERQVQIESGAWAKANAKERAAWEVQARIDALNVVKEKSAELLNYEYDYRVVMAERTGEEVYFIEHDRFEKLMQLYEHDVDKYREYKIKLIKLEDEFNAKVKKRQEELFDDIARLRKENTEQGFENELLAVQNKIEAIKNKKESGGRGRVPVDLTEADISELNRLTQEKNNILKRQADDEIAQIDRKIAALNRLIEARIRAGEGSSPEVEKMQGQRTQLDLQKKSIELNLEKNTEKNTEFSTDIQPRGIESFFNAEQWQSDLQKINSVLQEWASSVNSILASMTAQYQQQMDEQIAILENRYSREYEMLDEAVKNKTMSELKAANKKTELEKKQKAEQLKIEREYKKKQQELAVISAIINVALGVTQALAGSPPPLNFIAAALVAVAGAVEISAISSQKFAKGGSGLVDEKKGGVLVGKSHRQGGIKLNGIGEAEDGEYFGIINRDATRQYKAVLPRIFKSLNEKTFVVNNGFVEDHTIVRNHINNRQFEKVIDRRAIPSVTVNVNNPYGREMLEEMRRKRPQTQIVETQHERIERTGNYTLITRK